MNNEPIAFVTGVRQFDPVMVDIVLKVSTPLYTHPLKTLTDEEILEIYHDVYVKHHNDGIDFARAILRKAQEK